MSKNDSLKCTITSASLNCASGPVTITISCPSSFDGFLLSASNGSMTLSPSNKAPGAFVIPPNSAYSANSQCSALAIKSEAIITHMRGKQYDPVSQFQYQCDNQGSAPVTISAIVVMKQGAGFSWGFYPMAVTLNPMDAMPAEIMGYFGGMANKRAGRTSTKVWAESQSYASMNWESTSSAYSVQTDDPYASTSPHTSSSSYQEYAEAISISTPYASSSYQEYAEAISISTPCASSSSYQEYAEAISISTPCSTSSAAPVYQTKCSKAASAVTVTETLVHTVTCIKTVTSTVVSEATCVVSQVWKPKTLKISRKVKIKSAGHMPVVEKAVAEKAEKHSGYLADY